MRRVAGCWFIVVLALLSCQVAKQAKMTSNRWVNVPLTGSYFEARAVLALDKATAIIGGSHAPGYGYNISAHEGAIYRWTGKNGARRVYTGRGQVIALAHHRASAGQVWAVISAAWKDYRLLHSADAGVTWTQRGTIPATSFSALVAGPAGLWAHGIGTLLSSTDRGTSWREDKTPHRPGLRSRFGWTGTGLLQFGDTLLVRPAGSESWNRDLADHQVIAVASGDSAASSPWLVGRRGDGLVLGQLVANRASGGVPYRVHWSAEIPARGVPVHAHVTGNTVRILATPVPGSASQVAKGWVVLHSNDGGKTWQTDRLDASMNEVYPPAALCTGGGFAVARDGSLHVYQGS